MSEPKILVTFKYAGEGTTYGLALDGEYRLLGNGRWERTWSNGHRERACLEEIVRLRAIIDKLRNRVQQYPEVEP